MRRPRASLVALGAALIATLAFLTAGPAATDSGQERAREAVRAGTILPLARIVAAVEARYGGRVIEVELEHGDDAVPRRLVYEVKILTPAGDVLELDVDAKTLKVLKAEGRGAKGPRGR